MNNLKRHLYIDVLRVLASAMVVAVHVGMHYIGVFKVRSIPWTTMEFVVACTKFAVPVFFMLSGAVILSSQKEEPYSQFIKRRLSRVAIPFLSYSIISYLFLVFVKKTFDLGIGEFFRLFISGDIIVHLWYLYALIPFYFLFPMLRKFVKALTQKELLIFIAVMFCLNSALPFLNHLLKINTDFSIEYYSFSSAGAYLNYVLIGYYIHTYVHFKNKINLKTIGFLAMFLICMFFVTYMTCMTSKKNIDTTWNSITLLPIGASAIAIMLAAKCWFTNRNVKEGLANFISQLGILSFSAYLIHMLVLRVIQIYLPTSYIKALDRPEAALLILAEFVIALVVSYIWAFAVSKIPVVKKIL